MARKKIVFVITLFGIILPMSTGLIIHSFLRPKAPKEYATLSEIDAYVSTLEEFVKPDGEDYEDPHFLTFYKKRNPSLFGYALQKIGLWQQPAFSPAYMAELLVSLRKINQEKGLSDGKNSFIHIKAKKSNNIFVFGDLHGALHSLVRDLKHLREINVLNEDLTLKDPNAYLLFNGDLIDRASYSVDILIVVSLLMKKNLDRVFYIAGRHERNAYWKDYSLKRELTNRARFYSAQKIPFYNELTGFFDSLPAAIYISGLNDTKEIIRISFFDKQGLEYDENLLSPALLAQEPGAKIYTIDNLSRSNKQLIIRAAIKTQDWRHDNRIRDGIGLLDQSEGTTNWGILSSPTLVHKKFLDFHDDAFALVQIGDTVREARISAIHQERNSQVFEHEEALNMLSGRVASNETFLKDIRIGSSSSLIRGTPVLGKQLAYGLNTRIREFNINPQYRGNVMSIDIENDDTIPRFAHKNIQHLLDKGIRYFLLPLGNETLLASYDAIKSSDAAVFFPRAGSRAVQKAKYSSMIHLLANEDDEARIISRVMKQEEEATKFALFYQDDEFGRAVYHAASLELKKLGVKNILALPYKQGSVSFNAQAEQIRLNPPDALGLFSTAKAAKEFIRQIGVKELLATNLFALSSLGEIQFRRFIQHKGLKIHFSSSVPNPFTSQKAIAVAFRKAMNYDHNLIDVFSFEAYIATSLFIYGLEKTKNPTPQKMLKFFESMKHHHFHDLQFNFDKKTRSLATQVFVESKDNEEWREYPLTK